jgi:hypothetical protein
MRGKKETGESKRAILEGKGKIYGKHKLGNARSKY